MKRVWILNEGSQGHVVQSRGLVRELAKAVDLQTTEIAARLEVPGGFARSLSKRLLRRWHWRWLFKATHSVGMLPAETPDLIIASGPRAMTALQYLAKSRACPSVFVQGTVEVPENAFTAVMRPFEGEHRNDYIFIPLLFTEITPERVDAAKHAWLAEHPSLPQGAVNTLFIGASSAKIRFSPADWQGVIRFVNDLWKRDASPWLLTTSHRTGGGLEELFRNGIAPEAVHDAVWYSQAPRKVTQPFLGLASRVFVTMDSLTMVTEAVSSGRPTFVLCPADAGDDPENSHVRYIRQLAEQGMVTLIRPALGETAPDIPPAVVETDYSAAIRELLDRLRWNP